MAQWNDIAAEYSAIRDSRRDTVFGYLLERFAHLTPSHLLDYGGGDGTYASRCASLPIRRIATYDPAPNMVRFARETCRHSTKIEVASSCTALARHSFDVVTFNAVWMCLSTREKCLEVLSDIGALMTEEGTLYASVTHPCFRAQRFSTYSTDFDLKNYLSDGHPFRVKIFDGEKEITVEDTHWSLGGMSTQLRDTGFEIEELVELPDAKTAGSENYGIPWLVIIARKVRSQSSDATTR
jgi:hypothetical protein